VHEIVRQVQQKEKRKTNDRLIQNPKKKNCIRTQVNQREDTYWYKEKKRMNMCLRQRRHV